MSPHAVDTTRPPPSLPLIDFAGFTSGSPEERLETAKQLVAACQEVGFAYIKNHGVPEDKLSEAFAVSEKFYDLPQEEKEKAPHPPGFAVHRGYSRPGLEKVPEAVSGSDDQDYKETYEVGSENNKSQPNVWLPDDVMPEWRPTMQGFYWTCWETSKTVLRALALGIGLEEDELLKRHDGDYCQLRLANYPPISTKKLAPGGGFARLSAHCDWSSLTFLFQDATGGLQVEDPKKPGKFIDVEPIEGTLVMNIGDVMMRWTNDRLRSTRHRVTLPSVQNENTEDEAGMTRQRKSIVYFMSLGPDTVIETLPCYVDAEHPTKYEPITHQDFNAEKAKSMYS